MNPEKQRPEGDSKERVQRETALDLHALRLKLGSLGENKALSAIAAHTARKGRKERDLVHKKQLLQNERDHHAKNFSDQEEQHHAATTAVASAREERSRISAEADHLGQMGEKLRTGLPRLDESQAGAVEDVLGDMPTRRPEEKIVLEIAKGLGFSRHDLVSLAPLADELGRPITRDGRLDLATLTDPETQLFLSILVAMKNAFKTTKAMPVSTLGELPVEDRSHLFHLVEATLARHYPHITAGSVKYGDLLTATKTILQAANSIRIQAGTDLFSRIMPAARRQILGTDGQASFANFL